MAGGLKSVRNRRDDALSRIGWDRLESMLAEHYGREGYAVEHVGTGGSGRKFDGGIDLKLRKGDEYILVQSKHWNAMQVPHNAVHELMGVMVNEGATGAILVTSGEFTRAAIEAATKQGHVRLIDGDDLRAMLGPLPEPVAEPNPNARWRRGASTLLSSASAQTHAKALLDHAAERLIVAAEDRIRGHGRRRVSKTAAALGFALAAKLAIAAFALLLALWGINTIFSTIRQIPLQQQARMQAAAEAAKSATQTSQSRTVPPPVQAAPAAAPTQLNSNAYGRRDPDPCHELVDWQSGTYIDLCKQGVPHRASAAEIRESQRKADEAMKVIEADTPDM
jgi:hypothetical protein